MLAKQRISSGITEQPTREPDPPPTQSDLVSSLPVTSLRSSHDKRAILFSRATEVITPELDILVYGRYGLDVNAIADALKHGFVSPAADMLSIEDVARVLMEKNAVARKSCELAVRHVVTLISQGSAPPGQFWDLKNSALLRDNPGYFTFKHMKLTCNDVSGTLEGYTVTPTSSLYIKPWVLFLESPIAVTQCIREAWGPSLEDVVRQACQHGYRIHLFVKKEKTIPPRVAPSPLFNPKVRPGDFKPSHLDFRAYQDNVKLLLMQQRVKAAALRGGILSRICSLYITLDELLEGPSPDVLRYGLRWKVAGEEFVLIEDFVSEGEIQLLCGFFILDCSLTSGRAGQFKYVSFFPSPQAWENSGIHPGMWSNSGEEKFKAIMKQLNPEVGRGSPEPILVPVKRSDQWKSTLRLHTKQTKKFLSFVETEARVFLSTL